MEDSDGPAASLSSPSAAAAAAVVGARPVLKQRRHQLAVPTRNAFHSSYTTTVEVSYSNGRLGVGLAKNGVEVCGAF